MAWALDRERRAQADVYCIVGKSLREYKNEVCVLLSLGLACRASSGAPGTGVPPAALHTAKITGAYIALIGICLVVAPTTLFGLVFDVAELQRLWIRVFGSLCALLGWYYFGAARDGSRGFLEATVSGRFVLALLLLAIVGSESASGLTLPGTPGHGKGVHLPHTGESFASWFRSSHMGLVLLAATNAAGAAAMHRALRRPR
ncbi:unnamed protein product [Symbiodinium sp. CCMP2592]|nr:unnamed protein product [Symbiodinium sp. CCMP2592]